MLNFHKQTLSNGLRVVTCPMPQTKAVTIWILVAAGGRYEVKEKAGLAHFLEHMFFKGTKRRPSFSHISQEVDSMGAEANAFTGEEFTGFYIKSSSDQFSQALDLLSDIFFNPQFSEEEFVKEKGVIKQEINMVNDNPAMYVENIAKELWYPDQPLGLPLVGNYQSINNITRHDLIDFRTKLYTPEDMVVVIAGDGKKEKWLKEIKKIFAQMPVSKKEKFQPVKITQIKPAVKIAERQTEQTHLILGIHSIKRTDPVWPIIEVMNIIVGGSISSRLFTELREKRGLAYHVRSENYEFSDTGAWIVSGGFHTERIEETIKVILAEIEKIKTKPVSDIELKRAKKNYRGRLYLSLEVSNQIADYLAEEALFWPEISDPDDLVKKIENVSSRDIIELTKKIFRPGRLNLTIVGPYKDQEKFNKILKI